MTQNKISSKGKQMTSGNKEKLLSKHREMLKAINDELRDTLKSLRIILRRNHKDINEQMKHIRAFYPLLMMLYNKIQTIEEIIKEVE